MKFSRIAAIAITTSVLASCAHAQNIFRVGRPEYANNIQYDARNNGTVIPPSDYRHPISPFVAPPDDERVRLAWERYRNEAERYRAKYGTESRWSKATPQYNFSPVADYRFDQRVSPANYREQVGPHRCRQVPRDRLPADGVPADSRPRLRPNQQFEYRSGDYFSPATDWESSYRPIDRSATESNWQDRIPSNRPRQRSPELSQSELSRTASNLWGRNTSFGSGY